MLIWVAIAVLTARGELVTCDLSPAGISLTCPALQWHHLLPHHHPCTRNPCTD
jgi:hypothetical protein